MGESRKNVAGHMTLHRYFLAASRNRSLFLSQLERGDAVDHPHTRLHLELWYACLVPVIEGWRAERIDDPAVTAYLRQRAKIKLLERARNAIFHYSRAYTDPRLLAVFAEPNFVEWVHGLHGAISDFFLRDEKVEQPQRGARLWDDC